VRGEGEEGVAGDAEDGGDRVDGEDDVGRLDDDEHQGERGGGEAPVLAHEETPAVEPRGHRHEALEEADDRVRLGADLGLPAGEDLDAGVDEKGAQDGDKPGEVGDDRRAYGDEEAVRDVGDEYAP